MTDVSATLTVYHDGQFFVGLIERTQNGRLSVSRIVFGPEPSDPQILEWIKQSWFSLKFSPAVADGRKPLPSNPKRLQRQLSRELSGSRPGTKAQQAMQLMREQNKLQRTERTKEQRVAEKQEAYRLRQQKKLQKHRGH